LEVVFVRTGLQTRPMCGIPMSDGSGEPSAQEGIMMTDIEIPRYNSVFS
jgi:hypothetical protein